MHFLPSLRGLSKDFVPADQSRKIESVYDRLDQSRPPVSKSIFLWNYGVSRKYILFLWKKTKINRYVESRK